MDFQFIPFEPPEVLGRFLRRSFFARGRIPYRSDKILPNGLAVAIFNLGQPHRLGKSAAPEDNPAFAHSWLHGLQTTPLFNTPGGETHVLGLLFEPIGFHALFGSDMRALTEQTLDAREVLPPDFLEQVEAALGSADDERGHAALHDALATRRPAALPTWLWDLYEAIKSERGQLKLSEAYAASGRSARHVNARFKIATGVSPKVLCRIYRLQALLEEIEPTEPVNWTALAHRFAFYDQAHFNREFRAFSGLHPTQYLDQRRRDLPNLGKGESVSFAPQR